jgi:signal transduction histidine kinase
VLVAAVLAVIGLRGSIWVVPAAAATVLGTLLLGRLLALIGPVWLGPSYAERLERLHADAARAIERNRLAREIHDSVGHALSLVTLQASAARRLLDRDPAFADEALRTIETTSRRAVADLDHLLGLLRDERRSAAETGPALDADTLDDLLRAAGAAGLSVGPVVSGDLSQLPVLVAREAYRIVQEGLTNALKYSADRTAGLAVSLDDGALEILLTNPTDEERAIRAGRGLRGIRERAAMLGGRSSVGRGDDGWTLSVVLPAVAP